MKRGKKYTDKVKIKKQDVLGLDQAVEAILDFGTTKFEGKVEIHTSLNLNEKERKQPIRGSVTYSKPVGKLKKVLVFADPINQDIARKAGADYYGLDDLIMKVKDGWADFEVAIAVPSVMPKIASLGRILGTKGLMPNPKTGTVTEDVKAAVESYKGGKIDFKSDETGVIHSIIGNQKSTAEELKENLLKMVKEIVKNSGKQDRLALKTIYIAPTMGPSIKVDTESILKEL